MTKREDLQIWCRRKKVFSSVDVTKYGMENFFLRALRECRQLAADGHIRRIPLDECRLKGLIRDGGAMLAWWEVT